MAERGFRSSLNDPSQLLPQRVFHQIGLAFSAGDLADIGGIDTKLTSHPDVKSSEVA